MRDADFLAYLPVVASGDNANAIHYSNIFFQLDLLKLNLSCQNFRSWLFFSQLSTVKPNLIGVISYWSMQAVILVAIQVT